MARRVHEPNLRSRDRAGSLSKKLLSLRTECRLYRWGRVLNRRNGVFVCRHRRGERVTTIRTYRRPMSSVAETLEPRRLLSTYTVTNLNDSGPGSLRTPFSRPMPILELTQSISIKA